MFIFTLVIWAALLCPGCSNKAAQPVTDPGVLPNAKLTPGVARTTDAKEICSETFRTKDYRRVTSAMKKQVFRNYGIDPSESSKYEVDHLISLELGGANDVENLWPQRWEPRPGAHEKDVVENWLHKQVCEGNMSLIEAQTKISTDWYSVYLERQKKR